MPQILTDLLLLSPLFYLDFADANRDHDYRNKHHESDEDRSFVRPECKVSSRAGLIPGISMLEPGDVVQRNNSGWRSDDDMECEENLKEPRFLLLP